MNAIDKQTLNIAKYGEPNPGIWKRMVSKIFGNGLMFTGTTEMHWTAIYNWSKASKQDLVNKGYGQNVTVFAAINTISRVAAQAQWGIYRVKNVKSYERYKAIQKQPYSQKQQADLKVLKAVALEADEGHYLNTRFQNPNEQQSGAEYMENLLGFKLLTGDSYEYANMTEGGKVGEMWVLPSHLIQIMTDAYGTFPMRERGYKMQFGSYEIKYKAEEVCHSRYWSPYYNGDGSHLYGFSPLDAAWLSNLQDNNAREAAVELLKNRGSRGVFAWESDKIKDYAQFQEVNGKMKESWNAGQREYKDSLFPVFGKAQFVNVGLGAKDLAILEICKMNKDDICNAYGMSSILLNNVDATTYDNYRTARKALITNCVLPLLGTIRDSRNRKLKGDWAKASERIVCEFDPTIYTELYDDVWEMAEKMKASEAFTDNEIRVQANFEPLDNNLHDEVWKKTNSVPVSMINENTLTNGNRQANNQGAEGAGSEG